MENTKLIQELERLVEDGINLKNKLFKAPITYRATTIKHNRTHHQKAEKWRVESLNFLRLRFGRESDFVRDFGNTLSIKYTHGTTYSKDNVGRALGILEAVLGALKTGLTEDLFYKREVVLFGDMLDQAYIFLDNKNDLVSMIYGRIVLESTIKEFAKSKDKNIISEGSKIKFDQLIIELKKRGIISQPLEHSLRANYSFGSSFHDLEEFSKIKSEEIKYLLDFIRDKVLNLE